MTDQRITISHAFAEYGLFVDVRRALVEFGKDRLDGLYDDWQALCRRSQGDLLTAVRQFSRFAPSRSPCLEHSAYRAFFEVMVHQAYLRGDIRLTAKQVAEFSAQSSWIVLEKRLWLTP